MGKNKNKPRKTSTSTTRNGILWFSTVKIHKNIKLKAQRQARNVIFTQKMRNRRSRRRRRGPFGKQKAKKKTEKSNRN